LIRGALLPFCVFQSTRPHEARRVWSSAETVGTGVSIHAPARGATSAGELGRDVITFQSTRPHEARPGVLARVLSARNGFNPRARTRRDWAAPFTRRSGTPFQSTRPHEARHDGREAFEQGKRFQSTRPHEARPGRSLLGTSQCAVSIHAPARGATPTRDGLFVGTNEFQSTRPHEARRSEISANVRDNRFQSTRPHEARPPLADGEAPAAEVSIHAPARGATAQACAQQSRRCSFNPRARTRRDASMM